MRIASLLLFAALAAPASAITPATYCSHERSLYLPASAGSKFGHHIYAGHGVRVALDIGGQPSGVTVAATTPMPGRRICGMAGYGWYAPGTVGTGGRRSTAMRTFTGPPHSLVVTVARRSGTDGSSCSNPYVVRADSPGDALAGRVRVIDDEHEVATADGGGTVTRQLQWQSATGFRTCYAAGLGAAGFGTAQAFEDHRHGDSLSHVLDTFSCCPNHPPGWHYAYAAFRRV